MAYLQQLQVIKLGGSLITTKGSVASFAQRRMRRLAREVAIHRGPMVLLHGTGSFGKPPARKYHYEETGYLTRADTHIVGEVCEQLHRLRGMVVRSLRDAGVEAFSLTPAALFMSERGRVVNRDVSVIENLIKRNLTPVISGDFILDEVFDFAVCSSDAMAVQLAVALSAQRLIFATDAPGVMSDGGSPRAIKELVREDPRLARSLKETSGDVSGGMKAKVKAGFEAVDAGVETWIIDGRVPGRLAGAMNGQMPQATRLTTGLRT